MLNVHIIVAEVNRSARELLSIQGNIDGVLELIWVECVKLWDFGDDLAVFEVTLGGDPCVTFIHGLRTVHTFGAAIVGTMTGLRLHILFATVHRYLVLLNAIGTCGIKRLLGWPVQRHLALRDLIGIATHAGVARGALWA